MSHIIYQTEGIILGKGNFGEANSVLFIFTEKFGRISVMAQGVRHLKSKLRYNLSAFSFSKISLVKGKEFWRIVDAEEVISPKKIMSDNSKTNLFSKIINLLNRMIHGEEKNEIVWQQIKDLFILLNEKDLNTEELDNIEISVVLSILYSLGYIEETHFKTKKESIMAINNALRESHL